MSGVTDADRKRARQYWLDARYAEEAEPEDVIAQAIADERERVRAPFVRLADDLDREGQMVVHNGTMNRYSHITDRIRRAAEADA